MTEFSPIDGNATPRNTRDAIVSGLSKASALLVLLLALGAFFLSYESLRDLAANSGAAAPKQAWMFPLVIDGSIMVFSLSALRASLSGERSHWHMALVIVVTLMSVGLNAAHANGGWLARTMAAMPPLLLFFAFESLMKQVAANLGTATTPMPPMAVTKAKQVEPAAGSRREKVIEMRAKGLSRNAIARQLGVSAATIRRDLSLSGEIVRAA
ncbi:DUF2637 domain-containing protein [Luteolibacter sp. LG18]|uniref:DUF2637 domain-containing protein n=1 Tax=Luteolibacter sp. LG18 TaxID=2819286 RepID=UPI002B3204DE|nr:hypothetical protein llg_11090 [Luteolibacter sp. LG18]